MASGTFRKSVDFVLAHEGGYVNSFDDPGGPTNKGITIATFRRYIKKNGTTRDLRRLTDNQARIVYKRRYWDEVLGDMLPAGVDHAVFDFSVNSGPSCAARYLQKVTGAVQDGRIGPATLRSATKLPPEMIIDRIMDERLAYMKRIKHRKTKKRLWLTFGRGWQKRINRVRKEALDFVSSTKSLQPKPAMSQTILPIIIGAVIAAVAAFLKWIGVLG